MLIKQFSELFNTHFIVIKSIIFNYFKKSFLVLLFCIHINFREATFLDSNEITKQHQQQQQKQQKEQICWILFNLFITLSVKFCSCRDFRCILSLTINVKWYIPQRMTLTLSKSKLFLILNLTLFHK
jgi:hypothetical protein